MEKLFRMQKIGVQCIGNIELTESSRLVFTEVRITTYFQHISVKLYCVTKRTVIYTERG
jgi:hypothetical protein